MRFVLIAIALLFAAAGSAQAPPSTGTIVFYRTGTLFGAAGACPIRYKGREIAELGRGKYVEIPAPQGDHVFSNKVSGIVVTVVAGETHYVRCRMSGEMFGGAILQVVDGTDFIARKYERKEADFQISP